MGARPHADAVQKLNSPVSFPDHTQTLGSLPRTPSLVIALISPTVLHTRPSLVLRCCHETVCYQEYYDEQGEFGFRPSQHTIEHPNGRGKVEKRVLQACLLQELR